MIQRPRLFIAEVQVPVLERLGLETTDKEVSLNASVGAGCSSESLKLLSVGDVFLAEVHADEAAEERGEEWLRILEYRFCLNPSVFQDDTEDLENQEGSTDVSESEDGDREETSMQVYKGNHVVGGFVLRRHRLMGTFLRPLDKVQLNESPVRTEPAERDLPEESRIWPRDILERFVVTGERPCWRSDPGEESLALHGPMSQMEVEDALRTAALWLSHADALLVLAGEGMAEKTSPWPGRESGKTLEQICMRSTFLEEPQLAWDCWLHYCRRYRDSTPHSGFHSSLLQHPALGSFVVSSCWDGQWAVAGWASHLWELKGVALELRCATACTTATWAMPEELLESLRELPRCPRCGAPALPAVKLLDEERLDTQLYVEQEIRFQSFLKRCSEMRSELVILDLGTSPCSELRLRAERLAGHPPANCRVRLLRVQRSFPALPQRLRGTACAVPLPCVEALQRVETLLSVMDMGSFLFQDSDGCGAEVVAPRDAPLSFVFRKACQALSLNNAMIKAGSVLRELRVQDLSASDIVPAELFFKDRDDFPPVVRIWVAGVSFPSRNERLEQRLSSIWSLIKDLVEAFETEEYQRKFEAAPDRPSALKVIQEVQLRVLPCHGFAISGDEAEVATRITQMQGFLQSGRIDPRVSPALERSVNLSGYNRLLSKAMVAKNKSAASASRALVLAEPSKADPDDYWKQSHRPAKALWIASTWNKFSPQEMKWDGSKYYHNFQVGSNGWESFQLLMDGRWEQCVYPSVPDGCPFVNYELRGPNNKGHGKNWTVGRHPKDPAKNGDRLRITVSVNSQGLPKEVSWREVRRTGR